GAEITAAFDGSMPTHERHTKQIALAIVGLVVALVAGAFVLWPRGGAPGGVVRTRAGATLELDTLWRDRRIVAFFYPGQGCDSCPHSREEIEPHRKALDADVIAIGSHPATHADQFHDRMKLGFEIYVDPKLDVIPKWGVPYVGANATAPAVFVVEPGG